MAGGGGWIVGWSDTKNFVANFENEHYAAVPIRYIFTFHENIPDRYGS